MKICVISDTHTDSIVELPRRVLEELSGADMTIHAGDFTGKRLVDDLRKIGPLKGVYGNIDGPEVRRELPEIDIVQAAGFKIGVNHPAEGGSPHTLELRLRPKFSGGPSHNPWTQPSDKERFPGRGSLVQPWERHRNVPSEAENLRHSNNRQRDPWRNHPTMTSCKSGMRQ